MPVRTCCLQQPLPRPECLGPDTRAELQVRVWYPAPARVGAQALIIMWDGWVSFNEVLRLHLQSKMI